MTKTTYTAAKFAALAEKFNRSFEDTGRMQDQIVAAALRIAERVTHEYRVETIDGLNMDHGPDGNLDGAILDIEAAHGRTDHVSLATLLRVLGQLRAIRAALTTEERT